MFHSPSKKKKNPPTLIFQEAPIPSKSHVKYLGIVLDNRRAWGPRLKAKKKLLNSRLHLLRPTL